MTLRERIGLYLTIFIRGVGVAIVITLGILQALSLFRVIEPIGSAVAIKFVPLEDPASPTPSLQQSPSPTVALATCQIAPGQVQTGEIPRQLLIPKIDLNLKIVSAPLTNGTWPVTDYVANFAQGTSLPNGISGNTGLFGHDRPQAFAAIKHLGSTDKITLLTDNYQLNYSINKFSQISPDEIDVFYPTEEPTLTLITCEGTFSEKRYLVRASLENIRPRSCLKENLSDETLN